MPIPNNSAWHYHLYPVNFLPITRENIVDYPLWHNLIYQDLQAVYTGNGEALLDFAKQKPTSRVVREMDG